MNIFRFDIIFCEAESHVVNTKKCKLNSVDRNRELRICGPLKYFSKTIKRICPVRRSNEDVIYVQMDNLYIYSGKPTRINEVFTLVTLVTKENREGLHVYIIPSLKSLTSKRAVQSAFRKSLEKCETNCVI